VKDAQVVGAPLGSSFVVLAKLFLPAGPGRRGGIIEGPGDWGFEPAQVGRDVHAAIWGRGPDRRSTLGRLPWNVLSREIALRRLGGSIPSHLRITGVQRLPPRLRLTGRLRRLMRTTLRGGLLIELNALPAGPRVLDEALIAALAGGSIAGSAHVGSAGSLVYKVSLADRRSGLMRVACIGSGGDPSKLAHTLEQLALANVRLAPRAIRGGSTAGAAWLVEELLPGTPPSRLTPPIFRQIAEACSRFPKDEKPEALTDDLAGMAERLPERATNLERLAEIAAQRLEGLPAVLRHGDLWAGNLLVEGERVRGLVDWDAAHPRGVPGADLLQLLGTDERTRRRETLGSFVARRGWQSEIFSAALSDYWSAMRIRNAESTLDIAGLAWWASEINWTLVRVPQRVSDERWLTTNVDPVIAAFGA
jgi:hypothetical protein